MKPKRIGPKKFDHFTIGRPCPACGTEFKAGDFTTFIPLGPGADPATQVRAQRKLSYNPISVEIHYACATGERRREDRPVRINQRRSVHQRAS